MSTYTIPCETLVRLMAVATPATGEWFNTVRIDNGFAVATNRKFIVCEKLDGANDAGVIHIMNDPVLMAQCREEAKWSSSLVITAVPELNFASGLTTMGYQHPHNIGLFAAERSSFDNWRDIVERVREPVPASESAMYWQVDTVASLVAASPSGDIVFEENINANRGALIRDAIDPNWFAVLSSYPAGDAVVVPAVIPGWFK